MNKIYTRIFLSFFLLLTFNAKAQVNTIHFEHLGNQDGLLNSTVNCIVQDKTGYMWFATDNGLFRYNGYDFSVFKHNPNNPKSLRSNSIRKLLVSRDGTLYVGQIFDGGLSIFDPKKEEFIPIEKSSTNPDGLIAENIYTLFEDSKNIIWIGTSNGGLHTYDPKTKQLKRYQFYQSKYRINNNVTGIAEDRNGVIYVSSQGVMLCTFDTKQKTFVALNDNNIQEDKLIGNDKSLFFDSRGDLWITARENGLFKYDIRTKKFQNFTHDPKAKGSISSNIVTDIVEDKEGNLMVCTDGGGLNILDRNTNQFRHFNYTSIHVNALSTNALYTIFIDKLGIVWIGTYNGGVNIYNKNKNKFRNYTQDPFDSKSLSYKSVFSFLQDRDENIWIGTDGGGLNLFNPKNESNGFKKFLGTNYVVKCIYDDKNGNLYLGTWNNGIGIFNKKSGICRQWIANLSDPNSLKGNNIWAIFEDSKQRLWVSVLGYGLQVFDKNRRKIYDFPAYGLSNLSSATVKVIFEDDDNNLWFGTDGGGCCLFNEVRNQFKVFSFNKDFPKSIRDNTIRAIYQDKSHNLWFGTNEGGLNLYHSQDSSFTSIQEKDGLPSNLISAIEEDDRGFLWISTDKGICRYDKLLKKFRNFDRNDGLQSNEFTYASSLKDKQGRIYFGGINGFNTFLPSEITESNEKSKVVFTDFLIFNSSVKINDESKILSQSIQETNELHLSLISTQFLVSNLQL